MENPYYTSLAGEWVQQEPLLNQSEIVRKLVPKL
jgi:hypothetical protein